MADKQNRKPGGVAASGKARARGGAAYDPSGWSSWPAGEARDDGRGWWETETARAERPVYRLPEPGEQWARTRDALAAADAEGNRAPASQRAPYPARKAGPQRTPRSPVAPPNMTPGQEPQTTVGAWIDLLGQAREYGSWIEGYQGQGLEADRREMEKRWKATPTEGTYNGQDRFYVTKGDQFNDPARTQYVELPSYTFSGVKPVKYKYVGEPGKRQWTRDNVRYYDETTNPPWLAKPTRQLNKF